MIKEALFQPSKCKFFHLQNDFSSNNNYHRNTRTRQKCLMGTRSLPANLII